MFSFSDYQTSPDLFLWLLTLTFFGIPLFIASAAWFWVLLTKGRNFWRTTFAAFLATILFFPSFFLPFLLTMLLSPYREHNGFWFVLIWGVLIGIPWLTGLFYHLAQPSSGTH